MLRRLKGYWRRRRAGWLLRQRRIHVHGQFTAAEPKNIHVGAELSINDGVFLLGRTGITIGDYVTLSARCMLLDASLEVDPPQLGRRKHLEAPIIIEDQVWIGAGAIVLSGVTIGRGSIVGAASVVTHDVPPMSLAVGNPAKVIRTLVHNDAGEAGGRPEKTRLV